MLQSMGSKGLDTTEWLNWTDQLFCKPFGISTCQFLTDYCFVSVLNFLSISYRKKYSFHGMKLVFSLVQLPTPRVYSNSSPLSRWRHPTISSPVFPFSSCPQSFPASRSFQMSQLFASGGQSIGVAASTSVLPMNTQDWSPLGWTGWISLQSKDSQESSPTPQFKSINSLVLSFIYSQTLTSILDYWKNHSLD